MNIATTHTLFLIYDLLPPIYRVQFARVCRRWYDLAPEDTRDIHAVILARLPHPYIREVFTHGGYIAGDFLLDCLYGTSYAKSINLVFDIGVKHHAYLTMPRPSKILKKEQSDPALRSFNGFVRGMSALPWPVTAQVATRRVRSAMKKIPPYNYRSIYAASMITVRITITNPGIHNYMNACYLKFGGVLYTGTTLVFSDIMSIIRRSSAVKAIGDISITAIDDNDAYVRCADNQIKSILPCMLQEYIDRGFTLHQGPDISLAVNKQ